MDRLGCAGHLFQHFLVVPILLRLHRHLYWDALVRRDKLGFLVEKSEEDKDECVNAGKRPVS